jgi:replication factor C large subunit
MNFPENTPWVEKHRANNFSSIKGQDESINELRNFLENFPKKKAIVLHGPPGVGKTTMAYAAARELNAEILELNASDLRNKDKINSIVGPASSQSPLFKKYKIILVDEVDGISIVDRGGLPKLLEIIDKSAFPVVVTANDIWNKKFSALRKKARLVALKPLDYKVVLTILKALAIEESVEVSVEVLTSIAIKAKGDLRAAINDLQIISKIEGEIKPEDIGERNKEESIFSALQHVFKNSNLDSKMFGIYDEVNMPIDELFLWVEENIPLEYKGVELARAYNALSKADVFRGRIYRQQYWRFMVYEYFLLGAGIASAKNSNRTGWTNYKKPTRILKIWLQNQRAVKKKSICQKYAKHCHISLKRSMKEFMMIKILLKNLKIRQELRLDEEEIAYLDKPLSSEK